MKSGRRLCVEFICLAALFAAPALAAGVDSRKSELQDLKGRIEALRRDMAAAEESRSYAADQLRETESAISDANRRLHGLEAEHADVKGQLADLAAQGQRLDRQTAAQQNQLARLLNRQFVGGDSGALKLLLSGRDPNQAARDRYFLTQLSLAKAELIQQLRAAAAEKQRLAEAARQRHEQLAEIERSEREDRAQLLARKKQRLTALAAIADRLKAQRREITTLKRDEQRLGKLIEGLARIAATRKTTPKPGRGEPAGTRTAKVKNRDPGDVGGAFAALRGHLKLPVKGSIAGRFGSPRRGGRQLEGNLHPCRRGRRGQGGGGRLGGVLRLAARIRQPAHRRPRRRLPVRLRQQRIPAGGSGRQRQERRAGRHGGKQRRQPRLGFIL